MPQPDDEGESCAQRRAEDNGGIEYLKVAVAPPRQCDRLAVTGRLPTRNQITFFGKPIIFNFI
jgi:hypothetical protein